MADSTINSEVNIEVNGVPMKARKGQMIIQCGGSLASLAPAPGAITIFPSDVSKWIPPLAM